MIKRTWLVWTVILAALAALSMSLQAAPLDSRIPGDAIFYAGWRGADALAPQYDKSNLKGLVDNGKLKDYLVENLPKWLSQNDPEKLKDVKEKLASAELLWRHHIAFYMGPTSIDMQQGLPKIRLAVLCDAGTDAPAIQKLAEQIVDLLQIPPMFKPTVTLDENVVIVTFNGIEASELSAPASPLNTTPAFTAALKGMRDDAALTLFFDAHGFVSNIMGVAGPAGGAQIEQPFNTVGLTSMTQLAYTAGFDGPAWKEQFFVGIDGPKRGLLTVLDAPAISDDALPLVPKTAVAVSIHQVDLNKIWSAVRDMYALNPSGLNEFDDGIKATSKAAGFDIEKELIAALGNEWVVYSAAAGEDGTHPIVFVQKIKDPAGIAKALAAAEKQINTMGAGKVKCEKIDTGKFEVTGVRLPQVTIAWALRGSYLYVSTPDGIVTAADHVENKGESITANPAFAKILAELPGDKPSSLSYSEPAKLYPQAYRLANDLLPLARLAGANIPGDLLPLPKKAAPFLTPGWSSAWSDTKGYHMVQTSAIPGASALSGQIWGPTPIPVEIATIVLPGALRAQTSAKSNALLSQTYTMASLCQAYAADNHGDFPDHLGRLVASGKIEGAQLFVVADSGTQALKITPELKAAMTNDFDTFAKALDEHCDFIYLGKGLTTSDDNDLVICYEKAGPWSHGKTAALFLDGHVEQLAADRLGDVFKKTNESLKKRDLPAVDVETLKQEIGEKE